MSFDSKIFWHKTDEFNREMINGARRGGRTLKNKLNELQIVDSRDLVNFVGYQTRKRNGEIYALRWKIYRYGFIKETGTKSVKAHVRKSKAGNKYNVKAHARVQRPRPWISSAMTTIMPDVADTAARVKGDDMITATDKQMQEIYGRANYRVG